MSRPFYRSLLLAGCTLSLLTFSACADDAADEADEAVEDDVIMEETDEMLPEEGVLAGDEPAEDTITVMEGDAVEGVVDSLGADGQPVND